MHIAVGKEISAQWLDRMRSTFPQATFESVVDAPDTIRDADAFIGRIPADVYANAGERLRWVASTGAGIETIIAIPELVASDVVVTNTRGAHAPFVAEHAIALLLTLNRAIPLFLTGRLREDFQWYAHAVPMDSCYGKRMLVLGMGNIGSAIAKRALAMDMSVVGLDLFVPDVISAEPQILPMEHLDNELEEADVLVVAVPHTPETNGLIDARRIGLLKNGAKVIVISRGRIVDEDALVARLNDGTLSGAGLDVFAEEPLPADSPLWSTPNLVVTPHAAPNSPSTREREMDITFDNIRRFLDGDPLINVCDKAKGF